jgi:photosystem II stability/assembly factor-like uncharacterized protein
MWEQLAPEPGSVAINSLAVADTGGPEERRDIVYAAVARASLFISDASGERWATPGWSDLVNGARTCDSSGIEVRHEGRLYVSCGRHIVASTDGGTSWNEPIGQGLPWLYGNYRVETYVASGQSGFEVSADGTVWITDFYSGLYRRPPGGSWEKVPHPESKGRSQALILTAHPTEPGILYSALGAQPGVVWRTGDGGATWAPATTSTDYVVGIEVSANAPDRVLVLERGRARLSVDAGLTWSQVQAPTDGLYSARFSEADPSIGYLIRYVVGADGLRWHLLRTRDGGNTWTTRGEMPFSLIPKLLPSPWDAETVYFDGPDGLMVTRDAGLNWEPFASGLPGPVFGTGLYDGARRQVEGIAASPDEPGVLYALAGLRPLDPSTPYAMWVYRAVDPSALAQ